MDNLQAPRPQMIDRGTQTSGGLRFSAAEFLMKPVKSIMCHNFLWDIDEPATRNSLLDNRELFMSFAIAGCSLVSATGCAMAGCFMGHNSSMIAGEATAGCLTGLQAGHLIEKEITTEAQRIQTNQATGLNQIILNIQVSPTNILRESEHENMQTSDSRLMEKSLLEDTKSLLRRPLGSGKSSSSST